MAYLAEGLQVITTYQQESYKSCSVRIAHAWNWQHRVTLEDARALFEEYIRLIKLVHNA